MKRNITIVLMCSINLKHGHMRFTKQVVFVKMPKPPDLVEVATRPDQRRAQIPQTSTDDDPLKGFQIPCFGDELTKVRFAVAHELRTGCHRAKQRLDHLYPYRIVGWHVQYV